MKNLVAVNTSKNICAFLKAFSENLLSHRLYDLVYLTFHEIICVYMVPKLRLIRCFRECISLCEYYFNGLSSVGLNLAKSTLESLWRNTEFLIITFYKRTDTKKFLNEYLNFVGVLCSLYKGKTQEINFVSSLETYIWTQREKLDCKLSLHQFNLLVDQARGSVWKLKLSDFERSQYFSATDALTQNFRRNNKYKGIKNAGNSRSFF